MTFSDAKKRELSNKYDPKNLLLQTYNYDEWFENKTLADTAKGGETESADLPPMPQLVGGGKTFVDIKTIARVEKVKERKGLKIVTLNKLLTRLPVLLAQIKAGNNLYKLKKEIRQILYLLYQ